MPFASLSADAAGALELDGLPLSQLGGDALLARRVEVSRDVEVVRGPFQRRVVRGDAGDEPAKVPALYTKHVKVSL